MTANGLSISDVMRVLEDFAPPGLAESWDSVGLQLGDPSRPCRTVVLALDLTLLSLEKAVSVDADLIITHHPLLFRPPREIRFDRPQGHIIQRLCEEKISLYAAHTNLDSTVGGLNDALADTIGLTKVRSLLAPPETTPELFQKRVVGLGRVGSLKKPGTLNQLAKKLQTAYSPEALRIIGHAHQEVSTIALCTGSGGSLMQEAIASGADCYVTGDVKYHQALDAEAAGIAVLDVGHFATEIASVDIFTSVLQKTFAKKLRLVPMTDAIDPIRAY